MRIDSNFRRESRLLSALFLASIFAPKKCSSLMIIYRDQFSKYASVLIDAGRWAINITIS